jgi:hypothetical protein
MFEAHQRKPEGVCAIDNGEDLEKVIAAIKMQIRYR